MGGDLERLEDGSPNLRWETAHASVPPNISRTRPYTVIRSDGKYELTKKGLQDEFRVVK